MKKPLSPITQWQAAGVDVLTVGHFPSPAGHLMLVGLDARGCHYVADQSPGGDLTLMVGPVSPGEVLDVAARVLTGTARTVSDAGLIMASALLLAGAVAELGGCAAPVEVPA